MNIFRERKDGLTFIVAGGWKRKPIFSKEKKPTRFWCTRCQIDADIPLIIWRYCPYCGHKIDGFITDKKEEEIREKAAEVLL